MVTLRESVLLTLSFFDSQNFAPTKKELQEALFFYDGLKESQRFSSILAGLTGSLVMTSGGFFAFRNREELFELRKQKIEASKKLWEKVNRFRFLFHLIPGVKLACVCNNLSFGNATEKSDIDFFIITKKNRLFLARLWMTVLFQICGLRRHGRKIAGRFCLSFFASEDGLDFEELQLAPGRDFYFAFWFLSLKPIYGEEFFGEFLKRNMHWLAKYYSSEARTKATEPRASDEQASDEKEAIYGLTDDIENFLASWQLKRAEAKRQRLPRPYGTVLKRTMLKFHNEDRRQEFHEKMITRFEQVQSL